ncbi:MAG TPA: AAA family ATPase [Chryseolinea sp.]
MELVERDAYLDILAEQYQHLVNGVGHTVFLGGEAGVGKTSIVNRFLDGIAGKAKVYTGACDSLFTPRPLGPLYDIAGQMGKPLLELLRSEKDRALIFTSFLQALSVPEAPVVLVFEDIHWADEATIDFIKFLARRIARIPCLFLLTYRDEEANYYIPLKAMFGELPAGLFTKLIVQRLSREAVDRMALEKGYPSGKEVYALTSGNPFYVTEILASYSPGIPEKVKDAILTVFHTRDETTQALWEFLSILPSGIDYKKAEQIDPHFPAGLEHCMRSGIIVSKNDFLYFKHELYRIAIEESMTPYRRKNLHHRILQIMLDCPVEFNNLSEVVHHARLADDRATVARLAPQAAKEAAALGAHLQASKLYLTAIDYTDPSDPTLVELYEHHAYECYLTNQIAPAIASQQTVLAMWRERKVKLREGDTLRFLSRLWWFSGHREQSIALAREAIEVLENGFPTRERALAYSNLAQLSMLADDAGNTLLWGNKAIDLAQRMDDQEILSHALNNVGAVQMKFGHDPKEGAAKLQESLAIALKNGLHEHAARAYTNLSYSYVLIRQYKKAATFFDEGLKYCEERDLKSWSYYMESEKVKILLDTGAWPEAEALALSLLSNVFQPITTKIGAIVTLARLKIRRGAFEEARQLIDEGKRIAPQTSEAQRIVPVLAAAMEFSWITGEPLPLEELKAAEESLFFQKNTSWHYTALAYWMHKCGLSLADKPKIDFVGPFRLEIEGDWKAAADEWEEAGCRYEHALALLGGDEKHQKQGILLLDEMGATATSEMLKLKLKGLGVRNIPRGPRESTRNNPAQLTGRQIEILNLLQGGAPNKEIADKLFISPKTVDHHISAILSKLEVTSRAKAVLEAQKLGILK